MAARTYSSTEVHLLKLVHDKLPMRRHVSRHQVWTSARCHYCSSDDTMDHLQTGICNPVSIKFRTSIHQSVQQYLSRRQCPPSFKTLFLNTLQHCLDPSHPMSSAVHPATTDQGKIGLRLLTRGFLTRRWRNALSDSLVQSAHSATVPNDHELTSTIAGLIKTMWSGVGQLWIDHLAAIHETAKTSQSPVTPLSSLQDRVRLIHLLKPSTLPIHAHYFHSDLDSFLSKATIHSLNSYITHYLPAIQHSIALKQSTATHTSPAPPSVPGTSPGPPQRTPSIPRNPPSVPSHSPPLHARLPTQPLPDQPPTPQRPSTPRHLTTMSTIPTTAHTIAPHPATEEPPHRKRNRRRTVSRVIEAVRKWVNSRRASSHT